MAIVAPKKQKLASAEAEYKMVMDSLKAKQADLRRVEDKLGALARQLRACEVRRDDLEAEKANTTTKLERAEKLIAGLGGERIRWQASAAALQTRFANLTGDILLAAGVIAYLGPFTSLYRARVLSDWRARISRGMVPMSESFSFIDALGDPVTTRQWGAWGLPVDAFSVENGLIITNTRRWPLIIDPQGQAARWVRAMEAARGGLELAKMSDADLPRRLEMAVQLGQTVLIESVGEELPAILDPLLLKQVFKQGGTNVVQFGDSTVPYSSSFRLYMATKLANPSYTPETSVKVTLVNFAITPEGLSDQLLGLVVTLEKPELEAEKTQLVLQNAEGRRALKEIEDRILHVLSSSSGNILDDSSAIEILTASKVLADDIAKKQDVAERTEQKIDKARQAYVSVAEYTSSLYFCCVDLGAVDPMYAYSLEWFVQLFVRAIRGSKPHGQLGKRIQNLNSHVTELLFKNVCRSLFEKDKTLFSFLLAVRVVLARGDGSLTQEDVRFLATGGVASSSDPASPLPWVPDSRWGELCRLAALAPALAGLPAHVSANGDAWRAAVSGDAPEAAVLPGEWAETVRASAPGSMRSLC